MATFYVASDYAYGINRAVQPGVVVSGVSTSGAGTVTVNKPTITLYQGREASVYNVNAPIIIGNGANAETVTPSAVSGPTSQGQTLITATFANAHGSGCYISSGTAGLQEAINDAAARTNGGVVIIDGLWVQLGGSQAILAAVTIPANVDVLDWRGTGGGGIGMVGSGTPIAANGAVPVQGGYYVITKTGSFAALTLAAPPTGLNGSMLIITARTNLAHQITATGLLKTGTAAQNVATFPTAAAGGTLTLVADNGLWNVVAANAIAFT